MTTVQFLRDYDHAKLTQTIAYLAGMIIEVDDDCAERAVDVGAAVIFFDDTINDVEFDDSFDHDDVDHDGDDE